MLPPLTGASATAEVQPAEPEAPQLSKKGKKRKTVSWPDESRLREYFYFDETERVNVNKVRDFGEAAKREMLKDRQAFQNARRLSPDSMEEAIPWVHPRPLILDGEFVQMGSNSSEKHAQAEREKGILQELFLSKESVPDTPHEPDPEPCAPSPPKLIPLLEDWLMDDGSYMEPMDQSGSSQSPDLSGGSKLPPVSDNLMGSMGNSKTQANPLPGTMQEILTPIMGAQGNAKAEDLMNQPDFSDKIKPLLGSLQNQNPNQSPPSGPGMQGPMSANNGFPPPAAKNPPQLPPQPHYPPSGPGGPFPGPHGPPGGPRMMGPLPPQRDGYWEPPPNEMRDHYEGMGGRGGMRGERGPPPPVRERDGPHGMEYPGDHRGFNPVADMSKRPICRHFKFKGYCRYEDGCAFYHPGINGPPLP